MARYYNLTITRRIKVHEPLPENCSATILESEVDVQYPFDCEDIEYLYDANCYNI